MLPLLCVGSLVFVFERLLITAYTNHSYLCPLHIYQLNIVFGMLYGVFRDGAYRDITQKPQNIWIDQYRR